MFSKIINSFIPDKFRQNSSDLERAKLLIAIILIDFFACLSSLPLMLVNKDTAAILPIILLFEVFLIGCAYAFKTFLQSITVIGNAILISGFFIVNASGALSPKFDISTLNFLAVMPLLALLLIGIRAGWVWFFLALTNAAFYHVAIAKGYFIKDIKAIGFDPIAHFSTYVIFAFLIFMVAKVFESGRNKVALELEREKLLIEDKVKEAVQEVNDKSSKLLLEAKNSEEANKRLEDKQKELLDAINESENSKKELAEQQKTLEKEQAMLEKSVKEILDKMQEFAKGDLTVQLPQQSEGAIGKLFSGFNQSVSNINQMFSHINEAIKKTDIASSEILRLTDELNKGIEEQIMQTNQVASATEEMSVTATDNANTTSKTAFTSNENKVIAETGSKIVKETIEKMSKIADTVNQSSVKISELGTSSQKIGDVIQVINDIAEQTNLLALNAAIEAARAGEHGRGFAVVASEIRKLSERTSKSTKEISEMIKNVQGNTSETVNVMNKVNVQVNDGIKMANNAEHALEKILESSSLLVDMTSQIAASSEQQSITNRQILESVMKITSISSKASEEINMISTSGQNLNELTLNLKKIAENFKIK